MPLLPATGPLHPPTARRAPRAASVLATFALAACDGGSTADPPPSFSTVQADVLNRSCGFSSCHGGGAGGLKLDGSAQDYDRLVGAAAVGLPSATLVVPGDAEGSYLVQKLEGAAGIVGDPMPQGAPLDADPLQEIKDWIDGGAEP